MKTLSLIAALALAAGTGLAADDYTIYPEDQDLTAPLPDGIYHSRLCPHPRASPFANTRRTSPATEPKISTCRFNIGEMEDCRPKFVPTVAPTAIESVLPVQRAR